MKHKPPFKRYIVFVIERYYPGGGLDDIVGSTNVLDECAAIARTNTVMTQADWYIVDRDTWERVTS